MERVKNDGDQLTRHHRKPRSLRTGRENLHTKANISLVKRKHHESYHLLFVNMNPYEMAELLNEVWIDPAYQLVVVPTGFKHPKNRK